MRVFLYILRFLIGIGVIGFLHVATTFLLPWPFHTVHVIFVSLVLILFLYEHGSIVWLAAILFVMLDFPSLYPFGLSLIAGTNAMITMVLLYRRVFTNRSLMAAIGLCSIGYAIYRGWYLLYDFLVSIVTTNTPSIWFDMQVYSMQLATTLMTLTLVYLIASKFSFQLQHTQIQESWFRILRND